MAIEKEEDYLRRNEDYLKKKEALAKEMEILKEERKKYVKEASRIGKQIERIAKEMGALNDENRTLNRERVEGIKHAKANRADRNKYLWYTVGFKKKDDWISCGEEYYRTKEECRLELEWFEAMFPEKEFGVKHVIRDEVNQENVKPEREKKKGTK